MSGIGEYVRRCVDDGVADADAITDRIMSEKVGTLRLLVRMAVRHEVGTTLRDITRTVERRTFEQIASQPADSPSNASVLADLLEHKFMVGDGRWVTWGEATIADHRLRAAAMRELAARSLDDADRHEQAIEMIAAAGVSCLSQIGQAQLAAAA